MNIESIIFYFLLYLATLKFHLILMTLFCNLNLDWQITCINNNLKIYARLIKTWLSFNVGGILVKLFHIQ